MFSAFFPEVAEEDYAAAAFVLRTGVEAVDDGRVVYAVFGQREVGFSQDGELHIGTELKGVAFVDGGY